MSFIVDLLHPLDRDMRVDLCCREARVAQQRLDSTEIGAMIEEVGRKAVAQLVRARILRDVAERVIFFKDVRYRPGGETSPHFANEERPLENPRRIAITMDRLRRRGPNRADALLAAFAEDPHTLMVEVEVGDIERSQLR